MLNRVAAVTLALGFASASVTPCLAAENTKKMTPSTRQSLARLTPAGMQVLLTSAPPVRRQDATTPGTFFRTKKGAVALALVAITTGFTLWSVSNDRKPVKSPVR